MPRATLPLQAGHPIADPRTGLLTPPWVIFFQQLILQARDTVQVPSDGSGGAGSLPPLAVMGAGYWTPITNGDPLSPEIVFDSAGECLVGFVPTP